MSRIHFIFNKSITLSYGKHLVNEWCLQDNEMPDIKSFNDALKQWLFWERPVLDLDLKLLKPMLTRKLTCSSSMGSSSRSCSFAFGSGKSSSG